jgi:hypothetical protein
MLCRRKRIGCRGHANGPAARRKRKGCAPERRNPLPHPLNTTLEGTLSSGLGSTYARFVKGASKLIQAQLRSSCPAYKARRSGRPLEHPAAAPLVPRPPVHARAGRRLSSGLRAGRHSLNRIGESVYSALSAEPAANLRIATQNAPHRPGTLGPDDAGSGRTSSTIFNRHRGGQPRPAG